jgi:hypothetical protein
MLVSGFEKLNLVLLVDLLGNIFGLDMSLMLHQCIAGAQHAISWCRGCV